MIIGLAIGAEREFRGHPAGLRTMALISAGSCMFTGLGLIPDFGGKVDPTRLASQVVTGVGFLGYLIAWIVMPEEPYLLAAQASAAQQQVTHS